MVRKIKESVFFVGSLDWDRRLFDSLIPTPRGTSYNSYIVRGSEKTALIDTVEPERKEELLSRLSELNIKSIDYLICNHAEQDHSGLIPVILNRFPGCKVVTNSKCKEFLQELLLVDESKFKLISDRETISLGDKTLEFIIAPWVHWPDTMFTYLKEDKILFSTDFFGSHLATGSLFVDDEHVVYDQAKRYFAQIMMPFRNNVKINLEKVNTLDLDIIAPSHGPLYNNPEFIINAYKNWVSGNVENEVIIPYVSMHGSTAKMVNYLVERLIERGITVRPYNLNVADLGELAMSTVNAATIVLASPAVLVGLHPKAVYAAYLINALKPKTKFISLIGSYGWGSKIVENTKEMFSSLKGEFLEPVICKGHPKQSDFEKLNVLADKILERHKTILN